MQRHDQPKKPFVSLTAGSAAFLFLLSGPSLFGQEESGETDPRGFVVEGEDSDTSELVGIEEPVAGVHQELLASVTIGDDRKVYFFFVDDSEFRKLEAEGILPEAGPGEDIHQSEAGYIEDFPDGSVSIFEETPELSILERYVRLTSADTPVPLDLVTFHQEVQGDQPAAYEILGARNIVDLDEPIRARPAADLVVPAAAELGGGSCGGGGHIFFQDNHCWHPTNAALHPNIKSPIWACDNTAWVHLFRSTGGSSRKNYMYRTVACHASALNEARFWSLGNWVIYTGDEVPNLQANSARSRLWLGGWWRKRRLEYKTLGSPGYIRAYSAFGNP